MWPIEDKFFEQNGGRILRQRVEELNISPQSFRIFTAGELDRATDGYSESRIIGKASNGCGTVYKGHLHDSIVAVKKCCQIRKSNVQQFIKELIILSNLPADKHIVRIIGACCDETPVPVVVYEYLPTGALHHHIHERHGSLSWEARLRIAAMTAEALACLHAAIPYPLFHRGVCARDVLLDEGMVAKVSDFGARLVKVDCLTASRIIEGRDGYLEPDFFISCGANSPEKRDVYRFGVVMAELLTGELAMSNKKGELGKRFDEAVREGRLVEMLEARVREEAGQVVESVAEVARECLMVTGEERPTMREVADELQSLMRRQEKEAAGQSSSAT